MNGSDLWITVAVFALVYAGMALGRVPGLMIDRTGIALLGALALVVSGVVSGPLALAAIDFPTLFVLFALMVLSAQYAVSGFYDACAARMAATPVTPGWLLALTVAMGGLLSAVLANDVVVFAMTPMLCRGVFARGLDARPFVLALAGAANAGSAATIIGNPQNILIGEAGHLAFWPFLAICGPAALAALLCVYAVVWVVWRKRWYLKTAPPKAPQPHPVDRPALIKAVLATAALLALFATPLPHIVGVLVVAGTLIVSRRWSTRALLAHVDWPLLILFSGLFIVTAALGRSALPAEALVWLGRQGITLDAPPVLAALSLFASNSIGNVPMVMLLLSAAPDLSANLSASGLTALALLSTLAGNFLVVGSLANIIAFERARQEQVHIGFMEHARCGVPMTLLSLAVAVPWLLVTM
jgi:Na+/H+ antiporter NhaD/arsenite permease-like protein